MKSIKWLVLLLFSVTLFFIGGINLYSNSSLLLKGEKTTGSISIGAGNSPFIVFSDRYGSSYIKPVNHLLKGTLKDKQPVSVIYNPRNPNDITVNSFLFLWLNGILISLVGFLGILFSFINLDFRELFALITGQPVPEASEHPTRTQPEESSISSSVSQKQNSSINLSPELMANAFGTIKPLVEDSAVSDIILAGPNAIFVKKGTKIAKSSINFPNEAKYDELIERMLTVADNSFSIAKPIVDGMVSPLVRIHAVHKVLCESYHYVTLRISRFNAVKYQDVVKGSMAPREVINYLRAMLLTGHTILLAGEVGTGKTTLLRGLGSCISEQESILVIEDTPEIKIEHPAVRYVRTRLSNMEGVGKVSPAECIKAGMRMAMNRIIFGEIRDPEAAESFIDVCVSGHPGMSTIHARSASDAVSRLELLLARQQTGVDRFALREQIGSAVQVIAYTQVCKDTSQRRITEVIEIKRGVEEPIEQQTIFKYSVSSNMPVWKVENKNSFYKSELKGFEGGYSINDLPDWLTLPA